MTSIENRAKYYQSGLGYDAAVRRACGGKYLMGNSLMNEGYASVKCKQSAEKAILNNEVRGKWNLPLLSGEVEQLGTQMVDGTRLFEPIALKALQATSSQAKANYLIQLPKAIQAVVIAMEAGTQTDSTKRKVKIQIQSLTDAVASKRIPTENSNLIVKQLEDISIALDEDSPMEEVKELVASGTWTGDWRDKIDDILSLRGGQMQSSSSSDMPQRDQKAELKELLRHVEVPHTWDAEWMRLTLLQDTQRGTHVGVKRATDYALQFIAPEIRHEYHLNETKMKKMNLNEKIKNLQAIYEQSKGDSVNWNEVYNDILSSADSTTRMIGIGMDEEVGGNRSYWGAAESMIGGLHLDAGEEEYPEEYVADPASEDFHE